MSILFPPRDAIRIETTDERVSALAARLWAARPDSVQPSRPIELRVEVKPGGHPAIAERDIVWNHAADEFTVSLPGALELKIALSAATIHAAISETMLVRYPALSARTLLEAPAAVLLSRRGCSVLHAAAVVGSCGAVVIRGAAGAGKSTLTAAAWQSGLRVLADESLLVARDDHDVLAACVRDLTLLPDAARLLKIDGEAAWAGGEEKLRADLFGNGSPTDRSARRVATLLLGDRRPGPARLIPLPAKEFRTRFLEGEILQERAGGGDPDAIAESWAGASSYRIDGTIDLPGAVSIVKSLAG